MGEALAVNRTILNVVRHFHRIHILRLKHGRQLLKSDDIVGAVLHVLDFLLLSDTGSDKHRQRVGMEIFHIPGGSGHRGHRAADIGNQLWEMLFDHGEKGRTAGGRHFSAGLDRFLQLVGLVLGYRVGAQGHLKGIVEAQLFQSRLQHPHRSGTELSLDCRGEHSVNLLFPLELLDYLHNGGGIGNSAEGTVHSAGAASDASFIFNAGLLVFVHGDSIHRTGAQARTHGIGNGIIRAGRGAASAFLAFSGVNIGSAAGNGNGSKRAGRHAFFRHTALAVGGNGKTVDGTALTGRRKHRHGARAIRIGRQVLSSRQNHAFSQNFPLPVNTTAKTRHPPRNNVVGN